MASFTDFFVIATAQSPLQFSALRDYLEKEFLPEGIRLRHREGSGDNGWILLDFGIVSANSTRGLTYVVLICTALLLAVGMSWSHLSRKLSGQVDMDQTD